MKTKDYITDAMQATLDCYPHIRPEFIERCPKCDGSGMHSFSVDNHCKSCEGTGVKDHQDLEVMKVFTVTTYEMTGDGIRRMLIDKLFNGDVTGPFEFNDLREVSNTICSQIETIKSEVWDQAWKAFLKNNPKNPYR